MSVWWIKLGIFPERIQPGHPEQNGRHERMHRTLKADVASPPRGSWEAQRAALELWREEFNNVRPHEALAMKTPASIYVPSARPYIETPSDPEYPEHFEIRRVRTDGAVFVRDVYVRLGSVLRRECIGLEAITDGIWHLWFGPVFLGRLSALGKKQFHFDRSKPVSKQGASAS